VRHGQNCSPTSWHGPVNTHKVRIAGIDAPENKQPFGTASKDNLSRLVFKRDVEARCYKRDRYGREVCRVYQGFADVGLEQVRAGMAWHFKEYAHEQPTQERLVYRDEEGAAKAAKRGLWADAKPVPPWEWRRKTSRK
jgi:endonuclease YncB( thermonuclease family)